MLWFIIAPLCKSSQEDEEEEAEEVCDLPSSTDCCSLSYWAELEDRQKVAFKIALCWKACLFKT